MGLSFAKKNQLLKEKIVDFYIPNNRIVPGICTHATPLCNKYCYGHSVFRHSSDSNKKPLPVEIHAKENYEISKTSFFEKEMCSLIDVLKECKNIRIHSIGEFYDYAYFLKWINVMKSNPNIQFTAYVKAFDILKKYKDSNETVPSNFNLLISIYPDTFDTYADENGSGITYTENLINELCEYYHAKKYIAIFKEDFIFRINHPSGEFFCNAGTDKLCEDKKNKVYKSKYTKLFKPDVPCDKCMKCYSEKKVPKQSEIYALLRTNRGFTRKKGERNGKV